MNSDLIKLWQMQIVLHFVKNYGYNLLEVIGDNQLGDFWLVNSQNKKYSVIRVSSKPANLEDNSIKNVNSIIGKLINNYQDDLTIFFGEDNIEAKNIVVVNDKFFNGIDISRDFGDIVSILKHREDIDENIVNETNHLFNELNTALLKNKNKIINRNRFPLVTCTIMVFCSVFFALVHSSANYFGGLLETSVLFGAYYKIFILAGEYWRFLTVGLIHIEFFHLIVNMIALYNLGRFLEPLYGSKKILIILILSTISGSILSYLLDQNALMVGISGGLYGLLATLVVYYFHSGIFKRKGIRNSLLYTLFVNAMISFLPGVGLYAHLGGFLMGLLLGILFINNSRFKSLRMHVIISGILLVLVFSFYFTKVNVNSIEGIYPKSDIVILNGYKKIGFSEYADRMEIKLINLYSNYIGGN